MNYSNYPETIYTQCNYNSNNDTLNSLRIPNSNFPNKCISEVENPKKINQIKDLPYSNGISTSIKYDTRDTRPNPNSESCTRRDKLSKNMLTKCKDSFSSNNLSLNIDSPNTKRQNTESEIPNSTRKKDTDQRNNSLAGSSVFNQRYHNVRQFPNYRQRKKGAFEKKLKHCGLELDEEVAISILRQFLQPFIYRDINSILDDYIKKYFLKAFDNIRENINITSENWSQILKCSISKSLYKQYCVNATIEPFDPQSADLTDFPYFSPVCKVSNLPNQKNSGILNDVLKKSMVNGGTVPDPVSDTNSEISNLSMNGDHDEKVGNMPLGNHCYDTLNPNFDSNLYHNKKSNNHRKRSMVSTEILNNASECLNHFSCSSHKVSKVTHSNQQIHQFHLLNSSNHSVEIPSASNSQFQIHNNCQELPNNLSEMVFNQTEPITAPFENRNISFFTQTFNSSISRNSSLSAMPPGNYLNSSLISLENNDINNHCSQST